MTKPAAARNAEATRTAPAFENGEHQLPSVHVSKMSEQEEEYDEGIDNDDESSNSSHCVPSVVVSPSSSLDEDCCNGDTRFRLPSHQTYNRNWKMLRTHQWNECYDPDPVFNQGACIAAGIFLFALGCLWPPLILLVTYIFSKVIPYSFRVNDDAVSRRRLYKEFVKQAQNLPVKFTTLQHNNPTIEFHEGYWSNSRGMLLCTCTMIPKHQPVKAVVCFCHGYSDSVSFIKRVENQRFVQHGLAFCAIEYEGHGRSDGPLGLINDWEALVDDVSTYFSEIVSSNECFQELPVFLMGESMGGAVAYSVYERIPDVFRGVIFCCPMCKIGEAMLPPQWVIDCLLWLIGPSGSTGWLGYLPLAPSQGNKLKNFTHKDADKRWMASRLPLNFGRNPRLATARELIQVTRRISGSLQDFDAPFLVLHGKDDRVTDPRLSQALYDESKSTDKSIKLYDGMWHAIMCGEPEDNINRVFSDVIAWIMARCDTNKTGLK